MSQTIAGNEIWRANSGLEKEPRIGIFYLLLKTGMSDIALLKGKLRQFPDFPEKGILFEDIVRHFRQSNDH